MGLYAFFGTTLLALALGRQEERPPEPRVPKATQPAFVDGFWWPKPDEEPRVFEPDSGKWLHISFPDEDVVKHARVAPWTNSAGQSQVVGQWTVHRAGGQPAGVSDKETGLARYRFPGGQALDRVPLDVTVSGPPCWFPDRSSRVLFASPDGRLYRFAFDESGVAPAEQPRAVPLTWRTTPPSNEAMIIKDPFWPIGPRWGGRLFVSIEIQTRTGDKPSFAGGQIWWLELDPEGTGIEAAGRVTEPPASSSGVYSEERFPIVASIPNGGLILAYLHRDAGEMEWELRVASLALDPTTGEPRVQPGTTRTVVEKCAFVAPVFSPDGRSVYALVDPRSDQIRMQRFEIRAAPGAEQ